MRRSILTLGTLGSSMTSLRAHLMGMGLVLGRKCREVDDEQRLPPAFFLHGALPLGKLAANAGARSLPCRMPFEFRPVENHDPRKQRQS